MKFFLILLILGLVLVSGCAAQNQKNQQPDLKNKCCSECKDSFSQSPVGVGPGGVDCGKFTTANPLSTECENYFNSTKTRVSECK